MKNNNKPLYQLLNEQRTQGEWDCGYGDTSKSYGIFRTEMLDKETMGNPICLVSPIEQIEDIDKANAQYIALAANNLAPLAEALNGMIVMYMESTSANPPALIKAQEALKRIS